VQDSAFVSSANVWSVALGAAVRLIDFGRIEGRIDAAKAQEEQAYQELRKVIFEAVTDVEQSMVSYAHIHEQSVALKASLENARKALELSRQLYKEGEVSFLDVLDAQRNVNSADLAASGAEYAQVIALISLYKSLGAY
jgi:outer membrane protein TolC